MLSYRLGPPLFQRFGDFTVRIADNARRSVVFFGSPDPEKDGNILYGGTGFLVSWKERGLQYGYVITARHVAETLNDYLDTGFFVRLNEKWGGSTALRVHEVEWSFPDDDAVDVAAAGFIINSIQYDHEFFRLEENVVDATHPEAVKCGDVVCLAGLFRLHSGASKSVPIIHTGHVAALPDSEELIPVQDRKTKKIKMTESYLIEVQSLDGLSGAPVYIHEMVGINIGDETESYGVIPKAFGHVKVLGIYTGSFEGVPSETLKDERKLFSSKIRVPVGMGTVVPIEKVVDLLKNHPKLRGEREAAAEKDLAKRAAVTDSALPEKSSANPNQKEDFTALLDAAARKPKSGGQTS